MENTCLYVYHLTHGEDGEDAAGMTFLVSDADIIKKPLVLVRWDDQNLWGTKSTFEVFVPGIFMRFSYYSLIEPVTFCTVPLEPVLCFHYQGANESYCSFGEMSDQLLPVDHYNLFLQGETKVYYRLLPGVHSHLDIYFSKSFVTQFSFDHAFLLSGLALLEKGRSGDFYACSGEVGPAVEAIIDSLWKYVQREESQTSFITEKAKQILGLIKEE